MIDRRPHTRRFTEPELEITWCALQALDPAQKYTLLRELATDLALPIAPRSKANNVRAAIVSLRDSADILGPSPSLYEYRLLRASAPELKLLHDANIRRWLACRTWNECLARALLDAASDGDFVTRAQGDAFAQDEIATALREFVQDHGGAGSIGEYLAWAHRPDVRARPGRRPLSIRSFQRYGGYRRLLVDLGLANPGELRLDSRGRVLPLQYKFTDDELVAAVRTVASRLGHLPRQDEYDEARRESVREAWATGTSCALPAGATIYSRFGNWRSVLEHAGRAPVSGKPPRRRPTYTDDDLLQTLRKAWVELGVPFSTAAYARWRKQHMAAPPTDERLALPDVSTFLTRFGSWGQAVERAVQATDWNPE